MSLSDFQNAAQGMYDLIDRMDQYGFEVEIDNHTKQTLHFRARGTPASKKLLTTGGLQSNPVTNVLAAVAAATVS